MNNQINKLKHCKFKLIFTALVLSATLAFAPLSASAATFESTESTASEATDVQSENDSDFLLMPKVPVTVDVDGTNGIYETPIGTVRNVLDYLGIEVSEDDIINVDLDSQLTLNEQIKIERVTYSVYPEHEELDYEKVTQESSDLFVGESKVSQQGNKGGKEYIYRDKIVNGEKVSHELISEKIITYPTDEITLEGTKNLEVVEDTYTSDDTDADSTDSTESVDSLEVTEETTDSGVLLKTANDDEDFTLPKVSLSDEDREWLERIVTGEFGGSYIGSCLIAQSIKCAIVYDGYTSVKDVISGMGYVGSTGSISTNAVNAVKYIFDENNLAVKHRLFYMCTEDYYDSYPGNFHSTQNFILQYQNVLFFDRW